MDSRKKSITEGAANIAVGYPINHVANVVILLPFAPHLAEVAERTGYLSAETQLTIIAMGMMFTVVSVVRQYVLRRVFERFGENENAYTLLKRAICKIKNAFLQV